MVDFLFDQSLAFNSFSKLHLHSILIPITAFLFIAWILKNYASSRWQFRFIFGISCIPALCVVTRMIILGYEGNFTVKEELPLHLCRLLALIYPFIIFFKSYKWINAFYFLVYAGTLQAVLTPDLDFGPTHYSYFLYWSMHNTLLILPFFGYYFLGSTPTFQSMKFAFLVGNIYMVSTLVINYFLQSNYFYTSHKPPGPSLLDFMGPWPIYIFVAEAITICLFIIAYLPFYYKSIKTENIKA